MVVKTANFPFDYLKNCASVSLSFTGCKSQTYPITIPANANLWDSVNELTETEVTLTASLTTSNKSNCFEGKTADAYTNYEWNLNYNNTPAIPLTGKTVTYAYDKLQLHSDLGIIRSNNPTYDVYVKTGDIYKSGDKKYLDKSTTSCVEIDISSPIGRYSGTRIEHGCIYDDMICLNMSNATKNMIVTLKISDSDSDNSIKITSFGKDYWIKVGKFNCTWGSTTSDPVHGGSLLNYGGQVVGFSTNNKKGYFFNINSEFTEASIIATIQPSSSSLAYGSPCIYEDKIISGRVTLTDSWPMPYEGSYLHIYNMDGSLNTELTYIMRNVGLYGSHGNYIGCVPFNGSLYIFSNAGATVTKLGSLEDPGPFPLNVSGAVSVVAPSGFMFHTTCEHKGKLYAVGSNVLVEFDGDHTFTSTGIPLPSSYGSLTSDGTRLIYVYGTGGYTSIPSYIEIIEI